MQFFAWEAHRRIGKISECFPFPIHANAAAVLGKGCARRFRTPFGLIHLNDDGRILFHRKAEGRLSGYGRRPTLGQLFFNEIAPSMGTADFHGRIRATRESGHIDIECGWFGDVDDPGRQISGRGVRSRFSRHIPNACDRERL